MTSSNTPKGKAPALHQSNSNNGSSETYRRSSDLVSRDKSHFQLAAMETNHVRSCLSLLECVESEALGSYESQRSFETIHDAIWLVHLFGSNWWLPKRTTPKLIKEVVNDLKPPKSDTGTMRRALLELWLTTTHQKTNDEDRDAMILLYVERLSEYNPEQVELVLRDLSDAGKFWPSWSEIRERLEPTINNRIKLISALRIAYPKIKALQND